MAHWVCSRDAGCRRVIIWDKSHFRHQPTSIFIRLSWLLYSRHIAAHQKMCWLIATAITLMNKLNARSQKKHAKDGELFNRQQLLDLIVCWFCCDEKRAKIRTQPVVCSLLMIAFCHRISTQWRIRSCESRWVHANRRKHPRMFFFDVAKCLYH